MGRLDGLKQWVADLSGMFFPHLCEVCDTPLTHGEEILCTECRYNMPLCDFHRDPFNTIHWRLMRHVPIERAAAYFYYSRDSRYANLILSAKYRGRPRIMQILAAEFARRIQPDGFFTGIDCIIPVPMHPSKMRRRGYNQADHIAAGLSEVTGIPVAHNLIATRRHSTQTHKGAYGRWLNARNTYAVLHPAQRLTLPAHRPQHPHILIVDDVITTGSTLASCCEALHQALPTATISVLTLAATELQ